MQATASCHSHRLNCLGEMLQSARWIAGRSLGCCRSDRYIQPDRKARISSNPTIVISVCSMAVPPQSFSRCRRWLPSRKTTRYRLSFGVRGAPSWSAPVRSFTLKIPKQAPKSTVWPSDNSCEILSRKQPMMVSTSCCL